MKKIWKNTGQMIDNRKNIKVVRIRMQFVYFMYDIVVPHTDILIKEHIYKDIDKEKVK